MVELDLPGLDGLLELLPISDLPVIVTSRRLRRRRLPDALATCVGLIEKPFGHDELMHMLEVALGAGRTVPDR